MSFLDSRYRARRRNNAVAKVLAIAATVFGLGWLVLILGALLWQGFCRIVASRLYANDAAARVERRVAQSDHRQRHSYRLGGGDRNADRHSRRDLYGRVRALPPLEYGGPLHQRHSAQRALDRGGTVHLRNHGRADGAFFRAGRRRCACGHCHSGGGAHHRRHADAGAEFACAKRRPPSACRGRCPSPASATARRAPGW